jgi:ABC-type uncharacterized transport system ATPase subunit
MPATRAGTAARGRALVVRLSGAVRRPGPGAAARRVDLANCMPARSSAIAGVSGNGQVTLAELLHGGTRPACTATAGSSAGRLTRHGRRWWQDGLARIPEDRHGTGVVGDLPLWENAVLERLRSPAFSRRAAACAGSGGGGPGACAGDPRRGLRRARTGAGLESPVRALSGGNMQKLILGRALRAPDARVPPRLIVAHQPTWGLDIGAVAHVQQQLIGARDAGAAVLLISDDLDEVLTLGDRVAVMHEGRVSPAMAPERWTRESLGLAMAGSAVAVAA